ncbi:hypothetical protein [Opitutus terrae]|nr:hypothetical protein [Opitutus terrae]
MAPANAFTTGTGIPPVGLPETEMRPTWLRACERELLVASAASG